MCARNDDPTQHDAPVCEGMTEEIRIGPYGYDKVRCNATKGLTAFTDWGMNTRYACHWHRAQVERRYGVMEPEFA